MYDGNRAVEEVTEWDEENRSYRVKLIAGSMPLKKVDAVLKLEKVSGGRTRLIADCDLQAKYGLLGKILERLMIKPMLGGAIGNLFAGVEEYEKTGREIQKGFKAKVPSLVV